MNVVLIAPFYDEFKFICRKGSKEKDLKYSYKPP